MGPIIPYPGEDLMHLGVRCDAVYVCPKVGGVRMGPLVPYAGKDSLGRNLVGDVYFNFRRVEPHMKAVEAFAEAAWKKIVEQNLHNSFDTVCGIPKGGQTFGQMFAYVSGKKYAYPSKDPKETKPGNKQEYSWDISQFEFEEGERVAVAEDVFNNFNNTDETLSMFGSTGAIVTLLVGALNRSPTYDTIYIPESGPFAGKPLPVIASIREALSEWEQDDPEVAADIADGNIELDVKKHWARLRALMDAHP